MYEKEFYHEPHEPTRTERDLRGILKLS